MKAKKKKFIEEKILHELKISKEMIQNVNLKVFDDYITDTFIYHLEAFVKSALIEERVLTYYTDPPSFLDWILRRSKKIEYKLKVRDLQLISPLENTKRLYDTELL